MQRARIITVPTTTERSNWTLAIALSCALGLSAPSARAEPPLDEVAAIRELCTAGPSAQVARAERSRAVALAAEARVVSNPSLVVEHQRTFTAPEQWDARIGISVPLGISGRRGLAAEAARLRGEHAVIDGERARFESAIAFRAAHATAVLDAARVDVLEKHQRALEALAGTLERLARGGEAAAYDLRRHRTQARLHARALAAARAHAAGSRARVVAWLGEDVVLSRDPDALHPTGAIAVDLASVRPLEIRALAASSRASSAEARAARRRWVPEPDVSAGYWGVRAGPAENMGHGVFVGVTLPLTFFDHGQGEAGRADAEAGVARARMKALRFESAAEARAASAQLAELLPGLAESRAEADEATTLRGQAQALYAAGEASLTDVLDAFRTAEAAELARIELLEELAAARLSLMKMTGSLLDPKLDAACGGTKGASR